MDPKNFRANIPIQNESPIFSVIILTQSKSLFQPYALSKVRAIALEANHVQENIQNRKKITRATFVAGLTES